MIAQRGAAADDKAAQRGRLFNVFSFGQLFG